MSNQDQLNKLNPGPNDVLQQSQRSLVFAVFDSKAKTYGSLIVHPQVEVAIRSFSSAVSNSQSFLAQFPDDYSLYQLGFYDDNSGSISCFEKPEFIVGAAELLRKLSPTQQPEV
jgi:hypothetical protein